MGTVFKITPNGTLTTLYSFCSQLSCTAGFYPDGLVQARNGYLYGTTNYGVFKMTPNGVLTTVATNPTGTPLAGTLVQAANGDFYATTGAGGPNGDGTVVKISPSGSLTTLYSFCAFPNCLDGSLPFAGVVQAYNGDLYGTTYFGGAKFDGTVFKITPSGVLTTLYSFCPQVLNGVCPDGLNPAAGLVQATNGDLYGTTYNGGANSSGTVFKITPSGTLTTLYSFCVEIGCTDGVGPHADLVEGSDGNLYGTAYGGGTNRQGTVFKITPGGTLTTVYNFCSQTNCTDGASPIWSPLVQATNGDFYGTTEQGGAYGSGAVFRLSVGLGPFVKTQPRIGKVGELVEILGTNLTGSTSVSFNGVAANFKVETGSLIIAKVPTGATTGGIQVVTPTGTLTSNLSFEVWP